MSTNNSRFLRLRGWMAERRITLRDIGERLDLSTGSVFYWLSNEYMDKTHHKKLLSLGVPEDLLPLPCEKHGRQIRKPALFPAEQQ